MRLRLGRFDNFVKKDADIQLRIPDGLEQLGFVFPSYASGNCVSKRLRESLSNVAAHILSMIIRNQKLSKYSSKIILVRVL